MDARCEYMQVLVLYKVSGGMRDWGPSVIIYKLLSDVGSVAENENEVPV
jgi:hypothetical protein